MQPPMISREVERLVQGVATTDGAGVNLTRVLTQDLQRRLDPFLMLDEFRSDDPNDYIAGFPEHPHRGFETVTYMLAGRMRHRDSTGSEGVMGPGGVQWMTTGRGILHSELPEQEEGLMHGFQLWLNLPARDKLVPPRYQDVPAEQIPEVPLPGDSRVKVIAGQFGEVTGPVQRQATRPVYLDVRLGAGQSLFVPLPASHNAFVYVYEGSVELGGRHQTVPGQRLAVLSNKPDAQGVRLASDSGASLLVLAGQPLNEPIAQWGPFVMNSAEEIEAAIRDFREGNF